MNVVFNIGDSVLHSSSDKPYNLLGIKVDSVEISEGVWVPKSEVKHVEQPVARAIRHNKDKLRYDLIPEYSIRQVARVMTHGSFKYAPNNWRKGMPWSEVEASLRRHLEAYKAGEDFDKESGLYHLAHLVANGLFLLDYYRSNPQFDDRPKPWLNQKRIVLDIDEVVCDWQGGYREFTGEPLTGYYWDSQYNTPEKLQELAQNKDFWLNLKVLNRPDFVPHAYVSSRGIPVEWTKEWIEKNDLPCRPVIHVPWGASKVEELLKLKADIFIDDRIDNVVDAQKAGITSFLMSASHNQHYEVGYRRINDLRIKNIIR